MRNLRFSLSGQLLITGSSKRSLFLLSQKHLQDRVSSDIEESTDLSGFDPRLMQVKMACLVSVVIVVMKPLELFL